MPSREKTRNRRAEKASITYFAQNGPSGQLDWVVKFTAPACTL
jgi:hypothetical protein